MIALICVIAWAIVVARRGEGRPGNVAPAMADEQLVEGQRAEVGNEQAELYAVAYFNVRCAADKML